MHDEIATLIPFARDRVGELGNWNDIKLLTVCVDRLHRWYRPGLLCIGDAAHARAPRKTSAPIDETDLAMTEVALAAGFGSLRRFNDTFRHLYGRPPSALRRRSSASASRR